MDTNTLPNYDTSENTTGCCPKFNPAGWDGQELHFEDKLFVRATTHSVDHVPVDMDKVFPETFAALESANAYDEADFIVLSRDVSSTQGEHFFAASRNVPGRDNVQWTGDYVTRVFEGPYEDTPKWETAFRDELATSGKTPGAVYAFYTTCPKCAAAYGENYVVLVAEIIGGQLNGDGS